MKVKMKKNMCKKHHINIYRTCFICGKQFGENLDMHMHSYVHHEAVEHLKGSEQLHKCWACDVSVMGLELYKEHIATRKHTYRLYTLHNKKHRLSRLKNYNINLTDEDFTALQIEQQKRKKRCMEICIVCCRSFPAQDLDVHMHSVVHHQMIEQLKGSPQVHKCWACDMTKTGMAQFEKHVGTLYHKYMLFELQKISADGKTVDYSADVDDELRALCDQRDLLMNEKRREGRLRRKEAKRQRALLLNQTKSNEEFTNDHVPQSCTLFVAWENQNDHPESIQLNQDLPKRRQESMHNVDRSNGPLVKRPCLENLPQEMSARATLTPEIEGGTSAGSTCDSGLIQSRMEANNPNPTGIRACSTQKEMTENEAVIPKPPLRKHTHSKKSKWKVNEAAPQSEQGTTREDMNGQEPYADSLPSGTSLAEMSGNDCQAEEIVENVQPRTVRAKKKKSNGCDTEQGETSLENSFETNSCNAQKNKKKKKDISHSTLKTNEKTSRKRKVNKLLTLSSKEDDLTSSLENVGDELFQAYSTLQNAYTEVQRLLAVKQQVTSEMSSLRAKRIKILQEMKDPKVGLNAS